MKIKFYILFICFTFNRWGIGQLYIPFPVDTSEWSVRFLYSTGTPTYSTYHYKLKGDTSVNGKTYHKIYRSVNQNYSSGPNSLIGYMREDINKKIYFKYDYSYYAAFPDTSEFSLYDYSLNVGDTFHTKMVDINNTVQNVKFLVYKKDSVSVNTGYRKIIKLKQLDGGANPTTPVNCHDTTFYWMQQVGSQIGLLYNEYFKDCYIIGAYANIKLICFQTHFNYIVGGVNCNVVTGLRSFTDNEKVQIFPNPAGNKIRFRTGNELNGSNELEIVNILSQCVLRTFYKDEIDVSEIPPGIYFLRIRNFNELFVVRFIKL